MVATSHYIDDFTANLPEFAKAICLNLDELIHQAEPAIAEGKKYRIETHKAPLSCSLRQDGGPNNYSCANYFLCWIQNRLWMLKVMVTHQPATIIQSPSNGGESHPCAILQASLA
jgi:hypothetical protein